MNQRTRNLTLLGIGVVLLALGALADTLGIGSHPGFGWKQQLAAVAGAVTALVGLVGMVRDRG